MNRLLRALSLCVLFSLGALPAAAASPEKTDAQVDREDWSAAIIENTVAALGKYLEQRPTGRFAAAAQKQIAELKSDLARREHDKKIRDQVLADGPGSRFSLSANLLGEDYKLWRSLTTADVARIQFEPVPPEGHKFQSEMAKFKLRDWPPDLARKGTSTNFIYISIRSAVRVGDSLARTLDGEGVLYQPVGFIPGGIRIEGFIPPTGAGTVYIFKGECALLGHRFKGESEDPMRFVLVPDGSWVYMTGKGEIADAAGKVIFSKK